MVAAAMRDEIAAQAVVVKFKNLSGGVETVMWIGSVSIGVSTSVARDDHFRTSSSFPWYHGALRLGKIVLNIRKTYEEEHECWRGCLAPFITGLYRAIDPAFAFFP